MRAIRVDQLRPGLVLGRPLLDSRGNVLLNRGVRLSDAYIRSLGTKGFDFVYIRDPESEVDVEPEDDLSITTRAKALQSLREIHVAIGKEVEKARSQSLETLTEVCASDSIKSLVGKTGPLARVMEAVNAILNEVLDLCHLAGLSALRSADAKLHDHSISVCVVSIMIGRTIGLRDRQLKQLAAGCLLHDIGKVFLDETVTDPVRQIRHHTLLGYELLKHSEGDILAPHVALEHHEHQDGSGLPRGTRSSNVIERDRNMPPPIPTLIGEIAAVANTYDHLLNGNGTKAPLPPDEALVELQSMGGTLLNQAVVGMFLRCVPVYPVGSEVLVRTGKVANYTGVVKAVNPGLLDRPVVILTRDNHRRLIPPITLDLKEEKDLEVQCRLAR